MTESPDDKFRVAVDALLEEGRLLKEAIDKETSIINKIEDQFHETKMNLPYQYVALVESKDIEENGPEIKIKKDFWTLSWEKCLIQKKFRLFLINEIEYWIHRTGEDQEFIEMIQGKKKKMAEASLQQKIQFAKYMPGFITGFTRYLDDLKSNITNNGIMTRP